MQSLLTVSVGSDVFFVLVFVALLSRPSLSFQYIAFNKPFGVICKFSDHKDGPDPGGQASVSSPESSTETAGTVAQTLGDPRFALPSGVYAAGRLDKESEGLLLLTDDGALSHALTTPSSGKEKEYLVQVERVPLESDLDRLRAGLIVGKTTYRGCQVQVVPNSRIDSLAKEGLFPQPRVPPVRERKSVPTSWLTLTLSEGKNRQVRHMTAAIGFPTLRLIRLRLDFLSLDRSGLRPGEWVSVSRSAVLPSESEKIKESPNSGSSRHSGGRNGDEKLRERQRSSKTTGPSPKARLRPGSRPPAPANVRTRTRSSASKSQQRQSPHR
uniref:Pseudouridine synthase RsuA/RluA-like domain-containing protein n=1 Tax=Chromera velia CCMP2878 TaxID=1169474 RepID=A0A0G4HAR7_9ALVE|mmetsp:Transcript_52519/g.102746  ORF Transcript_52519/g.102746 Transcript_52519/m.102746 type:complete len:326 (-) Transcript_52519:312-1289(-)|eukprot:Cvel_25763.t1-p1 / transcript=Cvel_25763.t1 / gene=Cvel_25763 / organism=Chromera_velia_CCMP2878 / gene_product=Ribosomal large subunit pseudouridine synthase E, putative / transcript_product=Ribosomal large subunit pseudouridine synthase E, putative / location=Cvel_scaffold2967:17796-18770(-) / protein_length=325 / sequence_SO=supercontig / SO=protein_coding / is_pseudo=false